MIKYISSWAEGIIIAVIIASIIEMILPKSNSSKYIKTILGVYILYTIISPAIKFITGKELTLDTSDYEKYFNTSNISIDVPAENDIYKEELDKKIKSDLETFGYNAYNVDAKLDLEEGMLKSINLSIDNHKENKGSIVVNKIVIVNENSENNLEDKEIQEIKQFLSETYSIDAKNITINSK